MPPTLWATSVATSNRRWLLISLVIFCENDGWKLRLRRGFSSRVNHNSETTKCIASKSWCTMIGGDTNINEKSAYCSRFIADPSSGYREVGGSPAIWGEFVQYTGMTQRLFRGAPMPNAAGTMPMGLRSFGESWDNASYGLFYRFSSWMILGWR